MSERHRPAAQDEPPPFLGTWGRVYAAVILYLIVLIVLFALFAHWFTPEIGGSR